MKANFALYLALLSMGEGNELPPAIDMSEATFYEVQMEENEKIKENNKEISEENLNVLDLLKDESIQIIIEDKIEEIEEAPEVIVTLENFREIINNIETSEQTSFDKTIQIESVYDIILQSYDGSFEGKKITCIGDSITYGNGGSDDGNGNKISYCNFLGDILRANVINQGVGGAAIADNWDENSLILRWYNIPQDSDSILIFAGINDFFIGEYGDRDTEKTFCHDAYQLLQNIRYNYGCNIYMVLTYQCDAMNWESFQSHDYGKYMNTLSDYANELGIEVIDLFHSEYLNSVDLQVREAYMPDGVHPNDAGNQLLAKKLAVELLF